MMLRLEKATLGQFGAQDMMDLITSGGWKSILPDALEDKKLLLISEQLRDLLSGVGWNEDHDPASAALPLALLLLSKAGAEGPEGRLAVSMETLQETLYLLSTAIDREIVNRMLQRSDVTPIGSGLIEGLQLLVLESRKNAEPSAHI